MADFHNVTNARRGTKSCVECRRRKIRCIPSSDKTRSCRGCEDRGLSCIPQSRSRPFQAEKLSSRARLSQLETSVSSLTRVVYDIRSALGQKSTSIPQLNTVQLQPTPSSDDSESDSDLPEAFPALQPSHLRSLFHNDLVRVDVREEKERSRQDRASVHLLNTARTELQKLIPRRDEVLEIATSASKLLALLGGMVPPPFNIKSPEELLASYEAMNERDVDPMSLASWLVSLACVARQIPPEQSDPAIKLKRSQRVSAFGQAVLDTVDVTMLRHDRLVSSVFGLGMAMRTVWLQMSQGRFHQAWLRLRHLIALAELMGLPKSSQAVRLNKFAGINDIELLLNKAKIWEVIRSGDRLFSTIFNLPSGTTKFYQKTTQPVIVDGVVQLQVYGNRLTDILYDVQDVNEINPQTDDELEASATKMDHELRELASDIPKSWWDDDKQDVKPDHVLQILYYYALIRVHLPFVMRRGSNGTPPYSRFACLDACEAVAQRYQSLRRVIPSGHFISSILDLQACIAIIVLLLTSYRQYKENLEHQPEQARLEATVSQVLKLMDEMSGDPSGSNSARHGVVAIRSLLALLQETNDTLNAQQATLRVPLFGRIHIRRNASTLQTSSVKLWQDSTASPTSDLRGASKPFTSPQDEYLSSLSDTSRNITEAYTSQEWSPLSWSIDNSCDSIFQDDYIMEDFDQFAIWQANDVSLDFLS